ncbi:MAG: hypothetical protein LBE36_06450 [Flavobacteriaceae bacterium]|jgi:hypothetical protein|nr:hypothetical protein [Flavobacteriaceae bacterium]
MPIPKHNLLPNPENPLLKEMERKGIGFSPLVMCEFFEGMDVLQIYGEKTKEYIYALYFSGKLVGHAYFGDTLKSEDIMKIQEKYFPPTWDRIQEYVNKTSEVWYGKYDQSQYAFVMERTLKKI